MKSKVTSSTKLLFIGDSITDCGWRTCKEQIGNGYVRLIRDQLIVSDPANAPVVINRGISGNKMPDLQKRWQRDVLDQSPDIVSIYIGINDVWHGLLAGRDGCNIDAFVAGYRDVLGRTRQAIPKAGVVLCEPSVLWLSDPPDANEKLAPYVAAVHEIGREFDVDRVIELHSAFEKTRAIRPEFQLTTDGVHPTSTGHMLIARTWMVGAGLISPACAGS
jgi:acyl-CoA thioesterase-1